MKIFATVLVLLTKIPEMGFPLFLDEKNSGSFPAFQPNFRIFQMLSVIGCNRTSKAFGQIQPL